MLSAACHGNRALRGRPCVLPRRAAHNAPEGLAEGAPGLVAERLRDSGEAVRGVLQPVAGQHHAPAGQILHSSAKHRANALRPAGILLNLPCERFVPAFPNSKCSEQSEEENDNGNHRWLDAERKNAGRHLRLQVDIDCHAHLNNEDRTRD